MGVRDLTKLLKRFAPSAIILREPSELRGKRVAIDASCHLNRFVFSDDPHPYRHLLGFYSLALYCRQHDIKPVFVFDGRTRVPEKKHELERRSRQRHKVDMSLELSKERKARLEEWVASLDNAVAVPSLALLNALEMPELTLEELEFKAEKLLDHQKPSDPDPEPEAKPKLETKFELEPETKPKPKLETKFELEPETKPKLEPETKPKLEPETKAKPKLEPETEAKLEPETEAKLEPETEAKLEPETKPKFELEPEPETKPKFELEPETKPKLEPETKPKFELEPETNLKLEPETKPKLEPEIEIEIETKLEPETEVKPKLELEPEVKPKLEPEVKPKLELVKPKPKPESDPNLLRVARGIRRTKLLAADTEKYTRTQRAITDREHELIRDMAQQEVISVKGPLEEIQTENHNMIVTLEKRAIRITQQLHRESFDLLYEMGYPCFTCEDHEAEAMCAKIATNGYVDAVVTEDTDALVFGDAPVFRHFFHSRLHPYAYPIMELDPVAARTALGLTRAAFVDLCILCGTDFSSKLPQIGSVRALNKIRKYGTIEEILATLEARYQLGPNDQFDYLAARKVFASAPDVPTDPKEYEFREPGKRLAEMIERYEIDVEEVERKIKVGKVPEFKPIEGIDGKGEWGMDPFRDQVKIL